MSQSIFFDKTFTHTFLCSVIIILMLIVFYQTIKIDQIVASNNELLVFLTNSSEFSITKNLSG